MTEYAEPHREYTATVFRDSPRHWFINVEELGYGTQSERLDGIFDMDDVERMTVDFIETVTGVVPRDITFLVYGLSGDPAIERYMDIT